MGRYNGWNDTEIATLDEVRDIGKDGEPRDLKEWEQKSRHRERGGVWESSEKESFWYQSKNGNRRFLFGKWMGKGEYCTEVALESLHQWMPKVALPNFKAIWIFLEPVFTIFLVHYLMTLKRILNSRTLVYSHFIKPKKLWILDNKSYDTGLLILLRLANHTLQTDLSRSV